MRRLPAVIAFCLFPFVVSAQVQWNSPNGQSTVGVVEMCLNNLGEAVPVSSGTCATPPLSVQPYSFTPLTPDQHNLAITTSTALTIPTGALFASVCAKGNSVNYTFDGTTTPTVSIGNPLAQGQCIFLSGPTVLAKFRAIQQAATATLDVAYTK